MNINQFGELECGYWGLKRLTLQLFAFVFFINLPFYRM